MFPTGGALGTVWCGQNGLVKLSFSDGDTLTHILKVEPNEHGLTVVDLYAVLDEVELTAYQGEKFVTLGGFEFNLAVEGAEALFQSQDFPFRHFNIASKLNQCQVGVLPGLPIKNGKASLVHWRVLFRGSVKNVAFRLDPEGLDSCSKVRGCIESNPYALYVGTEDAHFVGMMFGAGYLPAYLNWEGEPDLTPVVGKNSWREVGVFTEAAPREAAPREAAPKESAEKATPKTPKPEVD
jgi:hypothetical protein